jgi:peptide/nickel transport system substrate-binding protein
MFTRSGSLFLQWIVGACLSIAAVTATAQGTLRIAISSSDVPRTTGMPDNGFEGMRFTGYTAFEPLVDWDLSRSDVPAKLRPGLAESWQTDSRDRTKWIFKLRNGVKFHDGSPFNADAVIFNLQRYYDDKSPQYDAAGAGLVRARNPLIAKWRKIDDSTVEIQTTEVVSYFPYVMTLFLISSPTQWEKTGKNWAEFAKAPSGTGPFRIVKVTPRVSVEFEKFTGYWNPARVPKVDRMIVLPMPESTTRLAALRSGQVDMIEAPPPDTLPSLKADKFQISSNIYPHIWPYILDVSEGSPFRDQKVRLALNYAINRAAIVTMLNGAVEPAVGLFPKTSPNFGHPQNQFTYDPAKAKALLKEAGYGPDKPLNAKIMAATSGTGLIAPTQMNELIQQELKEVGVNISFETVEVNVLFLALRNAPSAPQSKGVQALNWPQSPSDVSWMDRYFHSRNFSPKSYNWGQYKDPKFDALVTELSTTFDNAKAAKLTSQAHEILVDNPPWLYVVHDLGVRVMSQHVRGFVQAQSWFQDFTPISIRK